MSIYELICKNQCQVKFVKNNEQQNNSDLTEEILRVDKLAQTYFAADKSRMTEVTSLLTDDRNLWVNTFEKNIEKVQKGAIFFIAKILWSQERIEEIHYPINHVLKIFNTLIKQSNRFSIIIEVMTATRQLVVNRYNQIYLEWEQILCIV